MLERELAFFESERDSLLRHHRGQFALIKGEELLGTFTTFQQAFEAGVAAIGNSEMLIQQVHDEEEIAQFPALSVGVISAGT